MIFFYDLLLTILTPIIKIISSIGLPERKITGEHYFNIIDNLKVGDVLLTKTNYELSNLINPNKYKHAGIYVGDIFNINMPCIVEATLHGVLITDIVTFLKHKDLLLITRPKFIRNYEGFKKLTKESALKYKGIPYDYLFSKTAKAFYCFELVAKIFNDAYPNLSLKCREIIKGKRVYGYEAFLDETFFEVHFNSDKGA